jgi:ATP-binding cassette subfamily B protein
MKNLLAMFTYVKNYYWHIFFAVIMMILQVTVGFLIPFLMITIIDDALPNEDMNLLIMTSLQMLGLALVGLVAGVINNYNSQYVAQYATADLRNKLFVKIQNLSFHNIDHFKTSRLITSATNDTVRIQQFFQMLLRIIIRAPLMIGVGLFLAITTSRELSNIFFISMPILIVSIVIVMFIAFPRFKRVQESVDLLNKRTLENVQAPRVIKSFVTTKHENNRFEEANENYRINASSAEKVMAFAEPIIMLIFNGTLAGVLILGSYYIESGALLQITDAGEIIAQKGVLIAFNNYSMQILMGLMMFAMMMIFISRASVSAQRIQEILDEPIDLENKKGAEKGFELSGSFAFDHVSFGYGENGNLVLKDVSFEVEAGQRVGIIGSTGSGKSTLIHLLPRLYDVKEGSIRFDGKDVRDLDLFELRKQIALVTQSPTIFSGSIGTNMMQGKEDAPYEDFVEAAKNANAYEFVSSYEEEFNHFIQQKGSNLSGGQKQRLSLARAFLRNPKLLILDDSTSAVDANSEAKIMASIEKLTEKMTTLIISQKISTIRNLDKILVLNNKGGIDGFDTHENLLKDSLVYQEIAKSQIGTGGEEHGE